MKANADLAIHFMEDDFVQTHDSDSDNSDSDSDWTPFKLFENNLLLGGETREEFSSVKWSQTTIWLKNSCETRQASRFLLRN